MPMTDSDAAKMHHFLCSKIISYPHGKFIELNFKDIAELVTEVQKALK